MPLAVQYQGEGDLVVRSVSQEPPAAGQVEIAPAFTGICGTDLHIRAGHFDGDIATPVTLGHESAGRVVALGPGVQGFAIGDPVVVVPHRADDTCPACLRGSRHLCRQLDFFGYSSPGALQQRWVVPAANVVPLPQDADLRAAALVEPLAVAVHDVARAGVQEGEPVVVVGGGPVGLLIALVAGRIGAHVQVVEIDQGRRQFAAALGLRVVDPTQADGASAPVDATGGTGAAVAFEVSGSAPGFATALGALREGGRLCQVGIHAQPRQVDLYEVYMRELTLLGARLYTRQDVEEAARLGTSGELGLHRLITDVVPLEAAAAAFDGLAQGTGAVKILVDCQAGV